MRLGEGLTRLLTYGCLAAETGRGGSTRHSCGVSPFSTRPHRSLAASQSPTIAAQSCCQAVNSQYSGHLPKNRTLLHATAASRRASPGYATTERLVQVLLSTVLRWTGLSASPVLGNCSFEKCNSPPDGRSLVRLRRKFCGLKR